MLRRLSLAAYSPGTWRCDCESVAKFSNPAQDEISSVRKRRCECLVSSCRHRRLIGCHSAGMRECMDFDMSVEIMHIMSVEIMHITNRIFVKNRTNVRNFLDWAGLSREKETQEERKQKICASKSLVVFCRSCEIYSSFHFEIWTEQISIDT